MPTDINVNGTLFPAVSGEATHGEQYGLGGYRSVTTIAERNAIPAGLLKTGMVVFVDDGDGAFDPASDFFFEEKSDDVIDEGIVIEDGDYDDETPAGDGIWQVTFVTGEGGDDAVMFILQGASLGTINHIPASFCYSVGCAM